MGTVVEVEGNDEAKLKECGIHNSTSLSSPKQISDPVVYKLVRANKEIGLVLGINIE
ncbi:hypothetical protein OIU78_014339 [Salix suchowensis]|nr:hypothetical protein OIU78_014339 [Salix suchowensis]